METLLLALSPFLVALVTWGVKQFGTVAKSTGRTTILRFLVAAFSYFAIIGSAYLSGVDVDPASTETFVEALLVFLGSTGVYFFGKKVA